MGNLGQNIDVVAGIFDETMLGLRKCAGLELSREPICCAVSIHHRLAQKDSLTIQDLYGERLMLMHRDWSRYVDLLRDDLWKNHPQIHIVDFDFYDVGVFNPVREQQLRADGRGKLALCPPAAENPPGGVGAIPSPLGCSTPPGPPRWSSSFCRPCRLWGVRK